MTLQPSLQTDYEICLSMCFVPQVIQCKLTYQDINPLHANADLSRQCQELTKAPFQCRVIVSNILYD
jgi:hypothetical protein